eukprot:s5853_g2.t1
MSGNEPSEQPVRKLKGFRKRWSGEALSGDESEARSSAVSSVHTDANVGVIWKENLDFFGDSLETDWEHVEPQPEISDCYEPESPVTDNPADVGFPTVCDPLGREPAWVSCALESASKRLKFEATKLPWEVGHFGQVFRTADKWSGTVLSNFSNSFLPTGIGGTDVLNSVVVNSNQDQSSSSVFEPPVLKMNVKRVRYELPDEDIRRVALCKLRDLVLQDPLATQLGVSVHGLVTSGSNPELVEQSVRDCFRMKASSTLQKRAGSLWRFAKLLRQAGHLNPLRVTEEQLYEALTSLREEGAGATSGQHMLEALFFLDSSAKLLLIDLHQVVSGRCKGVAKDMYLTKNPLAQKYPLSLQHVRFLEVQFFTLGSAMRCILGQILFCIHACCRWKDAQRLKSLFSESGHGEVLIHSDALQSKTTLSAEARTRFLPYVALGSGVTGYDWGSEWIKARAQEQLGLGDFTLPSFSERTGSWTPSPMCASEATYWLREFLGSSESGADLLRYGSHSCKRTILTWVGRCLSVSFSPAERRLLGHHLEPGMRSVMTYSRESFTSLYAKVLQMFRLMCEGSFDPDLPAIDRVVQISEVELPVQSSVPQKDHSEFEVGSDSESSVASECGDVGDEVVREQLDTRVELTSLFPDFPGVPEDALLVHRVSGIVHVVSEDDFLACGRQVSIHFRPYSNMVRDRIAEAMSATLDSEAAFTDRAEQIGVERWIINKFKAKKFATFGKLAFAFAYAPQNADDTPLKTFLAGLLDDAPSVDQLATLRRLFFEAHTMALTDVRHRAESTPDPAQTARKMPTAERVARQKSQEQRLGGIIFNPNTIPSNHLVDMFVEMVETGILTYVKPEACCSRAQEVELVRKDPTVSTDAAGLLKLGSKLTDPSCEANTEIKLRAAWQRRSLAMDLAGLASFEVMETWVQFLFQQLLRDQPRGFAKISLQQILDCDRQIFVQASHKTMGKLSSGPLEDKPLDEVLEKLKDSSEILQYLAPLPATRGHEAPAQPSNPRGPKSPKVDKGGKGAGKGQPANPAPKPQLPEGCVTHDSDNKPLCFAFQNGRCKFKGPPGKRWALSRAAIQAGFSVLSVDHDAAHAQVPMVTLDLTTESGISIMWDILSSPNVAAIHLGLPCGTASLARERPVAPSLRALGVPNPQPLRSAQHPLGLPNLSEYNRAKVDSANKLYSLALSILVFCVERNIVFSIENPARSWLWAALVRLSIDMPPKVASFLNALEKVEFHACCHGSTRRKFTGWLGTPGVFTSLAALCQNDHPHDPWGVQWTSTGWKFDTSLEAAYPPLLAQRVVACLMRAAEARKFVLERPPRLHDLATAAQGQQTKRHKSLIPEFHHFVHQPATAPLQPGSKVLAPHLGGVVREELSQETVTEPNRETAKVGFYHTPKQFLSLAQTVQHPMDSTDHLEEPTRYALNFVLQYPPNVVQLERKKNLLQAKLKVKQLEKEEQQLHAGLPASLQKVLEGKRLLVWRSLLEKYSYDDMEVFKFMAEGVHLSGKHDTPPCYPEKIKPATLTQADLERSAVWRRKALLGKRPQVADPEHIAHLETTAAEELDAGFLEGPFFSEAEVTEYFGHSSWSLVRRFVLVQGAELKLRPIDDCLEAQLNQSFTSTSYLKLQDIDYIAGLALRIAESVAAGQQKFGSGKWLGKCLDLSKAYKQMGIAPAHRHLSVIFFHGHDGQPRFYVANSLMFGATAAVYSFNRVSRSLWFLLNRMLAIPCGVFYDDFPLFSPAESSDNADQSASELLDILGWKHARTGPKGKPFETSFQVLGCSLNLEKVDTGTLTLENKPGRIDRLLEQLKRIKQANRMSLHEAQVLHGLLRYACGFLAGRNLHQVCAEVMSFGNSSSQGRLKNLVDFCDYATECLNRAQPRVLTSGGEKRPLLVFTDGAWEGDRAGIGAVVVDTATGLRWVWSGVVPDELIAKWRHCVGEQLICQIELYAMVALRWMQRSLFKDRRSIWWIDNEAARYSVIKGISPSPAMRSLVRLFYQLESTDPTFSWIERVPSFSNPADGPSRGDASETLSLLGLTSCLPYQHQPDLIGQILGQLAGQRNGER